MISHYYIVVEFWQTGFLLAKDKNPPRLREEILSIEQIHIDTLEFIKNQKTMGISNTYIIKKLKPILSYPIVTSEAEIIIRGNESLLMTMNKDFISDVFIYLLIAHQEITDFSNLERLEPGLACFFLSTIKNKDGTDSLQDYYLN